VAREDSSGSFELIDDTGGLEEIGGASCVDSVGTESTTCNGSLVAEGGLVIFMGFRARSLVVYHTGSEKRWAHPNRNSRLRTEILQKKT